MVDIEASREAIAIVPEKTWKCATCIVPRSQQLKDALLLVERVFSLLLQHG